METLNIDNITKFRYSCPMTFKQLLESKNITSYKLAKETGIPYATINDVVNAKTNINNVSLKHALAIADYLEIDIRSLTSLDSPSFIDFRYFRNNTLHDLKRDGAQAFVKRIYASKEIDYYYKNKGVDRALYLLALVDYLARTKKITLIKQRYNDLRKLKLEKPLFVGGDAVSFATIDDAEQQLNMVVIPEFKRHNIIEGDVFNVA